MASTGTGWGTRVSDRDPAGSISPVDDRAIKTTGEVHLVATRRFFQFTTTELITIAVIGVMGGFISGLVPFTLLVKTWFPFTGGTQLVSGHHVLWPAIAYGMTRRKGALVITATIKGFFMFLLMADLGIFEVLVSLFQGASLVAGFWIVERFNEGSSNLGWGVACGIGNVTQAPLFWIITGRVFILPVALFLIAVMFAFASGVLIAGLLGRKIMLTLRGATGT